MKDRGVLTAAQTGYPPVLSTHNTPAEAQEGAQTLRAEAGIAEQRVASSPASEEVADSSCRALVLPGTFITSAAEYPVTAQVPGA